ncbi:MAG: hypothetical protein PVI97_10705 [Candidatus Thiodiazotropha sp.]
MAKQHLFAALFLFFGISFADPSTTTRDWADLSTTARETHLPILVVFNTETCT